MQKPEIVDLFVGGKQRRCNFGSYFCFSNLKVKNTIIVERYLTDSYSAHPKYVKTSAYQIIHLIAEQSLIFQLSVQAKYTHFHNKLLYSYIKKIYQHL